MPLAGPSGRRPGSPWRRAVLSALLLVTGCAPPPDPYSRWLETHREPVSAYTAYLTRAGVADVAPMPQLLRRGRRWRLCGGTQFSVPAREQWPRIVPTLLLVRDLRDAGLLPRARIVSAWRDPAFNSCEGGSKASRHLSNNAVDIEFDGGAAGAQRLCEYWRERGPARGFGLGFYTDGGVTRAKIHVDTSGFRTWGSDFHRATSVCVTRTDAAG